MAGAAELNIRLIGVDLASAAFKSASASLHGLTSAVTAPLRGIGALQSGLQSAAQSAALTGGLLTGAVTAPIAAGFGKAIAKVVDLETNLNVLQVVTSASAAQMKVASDAAIALGADLTLPGVTAATATAAMLELGKAGLSFDNILAATRGTLQLATAGQLGFADAAAITGRALNAFKLPGSEAGRVADLLAAAANASTGEVVDMAFALRQASANAATLGIPIEQVVAAISQLANAGIVGQDAGTSLKTFFIGLTKNTKPAIAAQKELGISFIDAAGNVKPFPTILKDLNKALIGLPTGKAQKLIQDIFGQDAARAALILGTAGPQAFNDMLTAVTKVGAANNLASARTKGLAGAFENLRNIAEAMATNALLPLLPIFTQVVNLGGDILNFFNNLSPQTKASAAAFVAVIAAAGPLLLIFAGLAGTAALLLTPFGALVGVLAVLAARSAKPIADFEQFKVKFEALIIVLKQLLTGEASFRLLEVAIQNLTGIDVSKFTTPLIVGFTFARNAILTFIGALRGDWAGQTSAAIDPLTKAIGIFGLTIRAAVPDILAFGIGLLTSAITGLRQFADWLTQCNPLLSALGTFASVTGTLIQSLLAPALQASSDHAGEMLANVTPLVIALTRLGVALQPLADLLGRVFGVIVASLPAALQQLTGFVNVFAGTIGLISNLVKGLVTAIGALGRGDTAGALAALDTTWKSVAQSSKVISEGFGQIGAGQVSAITEIAKAFGLGGNGTVAPGTVPGGGGGGGSSNFGGPEPVSPAAQQSFAALLQNVDAFNAKLMLTNQRIDTWNLKLLQAPVDVQTAVTRWMQEI